MTKKILLILFTVPVQYAAAQAMQQTPLELRPLSHNVQISAVQAKIGQTVQTNRQPSKQETILTLPFIDDFSDTGPLPDPKKWMEASVFINRTFAIFPPTTGVATFDALNEKGEIYPSASDNGATFEADILTSQTVRLDSIFIPYPKALSPDDSVMLSFYFQPGGGIGSFWGGEQIGYRPAYEDRLILEFYATFDTTGVWYPVWETTGMSLKEMCPICDSAQYPQQQKNFFTRVVVPIDQQNFYSKKFKFRFRAYSSINTSLRTGGGQWHIDYVYLNSGRTQAEETVGDVAFVEVPQTLLNGYTAVPYNQFDPTIIKSVTPIKVTNLSANTLSCRYYNTITDMATEQEVSREPITGEANANIYPYNLNGFHTNPDISVQPQRYLFPDVGSGEKKYEITHILKSGILTDLVIANDTVRTTQVFGREFAFDDGTAEQGLGFTSANNIIAGLFTLQQQDTLAGLNICFNKSYNNYNKASFNIYVWTASTTDTMPQDLIYGDVIHSATVQYSNENNGFVKYSLSDTLILPKGSYFWGIKQTSERFLNIGLDQNNNASAYTRYYYYNSDNMEWEWQTPFYYGAVMVRPFFGAPSISTNSETAQSVAEEQLKVFPNPATTGYITLQYPSNILPQKAVISDVSGRVVKIQDVLPQQTTINIQSLPRGIYFITLKTEKGDHNAKFIVW
jgi:hypothetical protein